MVTGVLNNTTYFAATMIQAWNVVADSVGNGSAFDVSNFFFWGDTMRYFRVGIMFWKGADAGDEMSMVS